LRRTITALALGAAIATTAVPAAARAEPGLTVDPQSPAGVEYAIPLDTARGHGGGGGHTGGGGAGGGSDGSGSPALFGSGITAPKKPRQSSGERSGGTGAGARKGHGTARGSLGSNEARVPVSAAASYSPTGPLVAVIVAILLVGGGLGVVLRIRSKRTSPS
jgi:hypothetical protein